MGGEMRPRGEEEVEEGEGGPFIDPDLESRIIKLEDLQEELEKVEEEASDAILEVERKFNAKRGPIYGKRRHVIATIPDFWFSAILRHLEDIEVENFDDVKSGSKYIFRFKANPYFDNHELWKSYAFSDIGTLTLTSPPIQWKPGKLVESIRDDLWPNPLKFFSGEDEAEGEEEEEDGEDGEGEEEEGEEEGGGGGEEEEENGVEGGEGDEESQ